MKKHLSIICIFSFIISIISTPLVTHASENTIPDSNFVNYDAVVTGNYNNDIFLDEINNSGYVEGSPITSNFEKNQYNFSENINISFEILSIYSCTDYNYSSFGFELIQDIETCDNSSLKATLKYDGSTDNPIFTLQALTSSGEILEASIYGVNTNDGLFLSNSSHEAAKDIYYYSKVERGLITEEDYFSILESSFQNLGTENCTVVEPSKQIVSTSQVQSVSNTFSTTSTSATTPPFSTQVTGTLGWIDDNNIWHPLQYNKVVIYDALHTSILGTVYTDANGQYSLLFSDSYTIHSIFISVYAGGENCIVKTGSGGYYLYTSSTLNNVSIGSTVNIDWDIDMNSDLGKAFQISQTINVATQYVKQMNGNYLSSVTVKYPHIENSSGCFYRRSTKTIYVTGNSALRSTLPESYASWDVLMHEYGHHVQHELGITNNPGGSHTFTNNLADTNNSKDIGTRLAWGEAYPSVLGGMIQSYYASNLQNIATVGDTQYTSYNGAFLDYERTTTRNGEACEASIIGVLWDLYDSSSETHDTISFSHTNYWNMMKKSNATTMSGFCNYFTSAYSTLQKYQLGSLLSYYRMSASNLVCNTTETNPSFSWTANGTSLSLPNNRFDIIIYNSKNTTILRVNGLTNTSYTLTSTQWNSVLNSYGTTYKVAIISYQTSTPTTGGYHSEVLTISKPTFNDSSNLVMNTASKTRYSEQVITLTPGSYYDLHVTFGTTGSKLIQTFGTMDTIIELYSSSGTLLVSSSQTDDEGYQANYPLRLLQEHEFLEQIQ